MQGEGEAPDAAARCGAASSEQRVLRAGRRQSDADTLLSVFDQHHSLLTQQKQHNLSWGVDRWCCNDDQAQQPPPVALGCGFLGQGAWVCAAHASDANDATADASMGAHAAATDASSPHTC